MTDKILPIMNPYPGPKSLPFNDNALVHNKTAIAILCEEHGVIHVFFEPYSYDYNPIELVFHRAKGQCRSYYPSEKPLSIGMIGFSDG